MSYKDEMIEALHERFARPIKSDSVVVSRDDLDSLAERLEEAIELGEWQQVRQIADQLREIR